MDGLLKTTPEAIEGLSIEKRAEIDGGLPEELSIKDIAKLAYPDDTEKQEALIKVIVGSCKAGKLAYYGNIDDWSYREDMPNPYPKVKGDYPLIWFPDGVNTLYAYSYDCLIHRDYFKFYLQNQNQWPVNGLLKRWWGDDQDDIDPYGAENHESENKSKRKKGESDRERTAHVIDWVSRTEYKGGKQDKTILTALQSEKPGLWGKKDSIDVFRSWLKSPEAKEAKPLLPNPRRR
jgi:hypothetical protein